MTDLLLTRLRNDRIWFAIPLVALVAVYGPALADLVSNWAEDSNYSHGFLVPLVAGWLAWQKRAELARLETAIDWRGLAVLVAALALFVVGNGASEFFTIRFSFVLAVVGLTWWLLGWAVIRTLWFAFAFLVFMIPIPYVIYYMISFPLQALATDITVTVLDIIGMTVVRQGNIIHISGHSLEVAEACSGIRSLVSLLALGALYAYLTQKTLWAQTTLFLITIPLAVIGNVIRVFLTTIAVSGGMTSILVEPWHSIMGMLVFVIAFVGLFISGLVLRQVTR